MSFIPAGDPSYWLKTASPAAFPRCETDAEWDVVVIGGGLTGAGLLWFLLEAGVDPDRIALVEARTIAGRASGRNAGFLLADLAEPYVRMREAMGSKAARLRNFSLNNHARLLEITDRLGLDWELELDGVLVAAASAAEDQECKASAEALLSDGFDVAYLGPQESSVRLGCPTEFGSLWDPIGGGSHPAKFVLGLMSACADRGVQVFEQSPAESIQSDGEGVRITCPQGTLRAAKCVLATNAYTPLLDPTLESMVAPFRGQMLSYAPCPPQILRPVVYRNHGFEYFRQDRAGRFHFGGFRQTAIKEETGYEEATHRDVQARLEEFASTLYPQLQHQTPIARWAGTMGFSKDGIPFVGPHPGHSDVLLCFGFNGHGFGLATECARVCIDLLVDGQSGDADLFSTRR